jgi:hypothetical protein
MRPSIIFFCVACAVCKVRAQSTIWQPSQGHTQLPIGPLAVPHAQPDQAPETAATTGTDPSGRRQVVGLHQQW